MKETFWFYLLPICLLWIHVADIITTHLLISYGIGYELNILMATMMSYSYVLAYVVKMCVAVYIIVAGIIVDKLFLPRANRDQTRFIYKLWGIAILFQFGMGCIVVINNLSHF